jgi:uncharacterized protein YciI
MTLAILSYTYVAGMLERREPYRDEHLALARRFKDQGRLLIVGALGDPPKGALLVFGDEEAAAEFAGADPYRAAGLITEHRIEPWNVVMHAPLPDPD